MQALLVEADVVYQVAELQLEQRANAICTLLPFLFKQQGNGGSVFDFTWVSLEAALPYKVVRAADELYRLWSVLFQRFWDDVAGRFDLCR